MKEELAAAVHMLSASNSDSGPSNSNSSAQLAALRQELQAMQTTTRIWSAGASHHSSQSSSCNQRTSKNDLIAFWECAEHQQQQHQQQQQQQQDSGRARTAISTSTPSPTSQRSQSSRESITLIKCQLTQE